MFPVAVPPQTADSPGYGETSTRGLEELLYSETGRPLVGLTSRRSSTKHRAARPRLRNSRAHGILFKASDTDRVSGVFGGDSKDGGISVKEEEGHSADGSSSSATTGHGDGAGLEVSCVLTSQLLLLYYLLLYEDLRLNSTPQYQPPHLKPRQHFTYSASLFSQLPIRYLLSRAQKDQAMYGGLFSALLKLLAHHYPQLCLVEDWLYRAPQAPPALLTPRTPLQPQTIAKALSECSSSPGLVVVLLERCLQLPSSLLWSTAAAPLTAGLVHLLEDGVPRTVLDKYVLVWRRLNAIYPRRLWAMTVEGLRAAPPGPRVGVLCRRPLTEDDLVLDPLYALRCHPKVFRRAPLLQLVEYILRVYLLSSRAFLSQHQQSTAAAAIAAQGVEEERDKLRAALLLTQESAAVQILLEATLEDEDLEKQGKGVGGVPGLLLTRQEVQSVVFSYLHQAFIKDTTLAKLVHFQGYPRSLVGPVVQGVPSMHIAVGLNWIPELLQQPLQQQRQRQQHSLQQLLFTLHLTASLALQNAMPSTLSIARLSVNVLATLISVLSSEARLTLVRGGVPALVILGRVFPCLLPDLVQLLVTCARLTRAHAAVLPAPAPGITGVSDMDGVEDSSLEKPFSLGGVGGPEPMIIDEPRPQDLSSAACKTEDKFLMEDKSVLLASKKCYIDKFPAEDAMVVEVTRAFKKLVQEAVMAHKIF